MTQPHRVETQTDAARHHRRETQIQILLPMAGGGLLLLIALIVALLLPRFNQVSAVSDFLVTLLLLCPLAICVLPVALILTVAALYMNRVHDGATGALGRLVTLSERVSTRIDAASNGLAHRAIDFGAKIAPVEKGLFGAFDRPESPTPNEANDVPTALPPSRE